MHIPDGFLSPEVAAGTAVVAAGAVGVGLRRAAAQLDDRVVPLLGVTGAFVFAAQMLNFPVAGGTSGHFLGAALATILLGPWLAMLVLAVVLATQSFVFADGGISALGANVLCMGVCGALATGGLMLLARRMLPRRRGVLLAVAGAGAWLAVIAGATATSLLPRAVRHRPARHRPAGDARRARRHRARRGGDHRRRGERADGHPARPDRRLGARAPQPHVRPVAAGGLSHAPRHHPRPGRRDRPRHRALAVRVGSPDGLEKVAERPARSSTRAAWPPQERAGRRTTPSRASTTRGSPPGSPASPARSSCSRSAPASSPWPAGTGASHERPARTRVRRAGRGSGEPGAPARRPRQAARARGPHARRRDRRLVAGARRLRGRCSPRSRSRPASRER